MNCVCRGCVEEYAEVCLCIRVFRPEMRVEGGDKLEIGDLYLTVLDISSPYRAIQ